MPGEGPSGRRVREVPRAQGVSAGPEMSERSREVRERRIPRESPGIPGRPRCSFYMNSPPLYQLYPFRPQPFQNIMVI